MEYGHINNKEVREYLRAAELLLHFLRQTSVSQSNSYELLLIKAYSEQIKSATLHVENTSIRSQIKEPAVRRQATSG